LFFVKRREILLQELEKVGVKRKTLDDLSASGRVSPEVCRYLDEDLCAVQELIEERLKSLDGEITSRKQALSEQAVIFEKFLAATELEYAVGVVSEEQYKTNQDLLVLGLEASRKENQDISGSPTPPHQEVEPVEKKAATEPQVLTEKTLEVSVGGVELKDPSGLVSLEKVKESVTALATGAMDGEEKGDDHADSVFHCMNPWNKDCRNTDIEVYIYHNNERIPICHACWDELADKDITW